MKTSEKGLALIKRFEGFSPTPYLCPAGYWTIGYGHVMQQYEALHIGEEAASLLLTTDVKIAERAVERLITVPLTQSRFDALTSFTFNLGTGALQRSTLRRRVNREEHEAVPAEFHKWVFAAGKRLSGLVSRRRAEALFYVVSQ